MSRICWEKGKRGYSMTKLMSPNLRHVRHSKLCLSTKAQFLLKTYSNNGLHTFYEQHKKLLHFSFLFEK